MKKFLGILVLSLLFCNVGVADNKFIVSTIYVDKKEAKVLTYPITKKIHANLNYLRRGASHWRWHDMGGEKHRTGETNFYNKALKVSSWLKKPENEIYYICE